MALHCMFLLIFMQLCAVVQVSGYYCDSDKCKEGQYCCGMNICCASFAVWQMWYFWCGIVLFVVLLTACAGFYRYRYYTVNIIIQGPGYSRLVTEDKYPVPPPVNYAATKDKSPNRPPPKYAADYVLPDYSLHVPEKDPNHKR